MVRRAARRWRESTPKTSVPKPGQTVVVRKGDTIYALARIHDITPADLIAWNRLDNPSTIYPGQVIRLYPQGPPAAVRRPRWSLRRARVAAVLAAPRTDDGAGGAGEQHCLALAGRRRDCRPLRGR